MQEEKSKAPESTFPSSSLSAAADFLRVSDVSSVGEALNMKGLQGSGLACDTSESVICGVFSAERSVELPPGVSVWAGVPPFLNGVLGGMVLSKTSGESGPPKCTLFFFIAGFAQTVNTENVNISSLSLMNNKQ